MKLENELCRKIYEHHTVLKGDLATSLLEAGTKAGLSKDVIMNLVNYANASVDVGSNKMALDFQKSIKRIQEELEK